MLIALLCVTSFVACGGDINKVKSISIVGKDTVAVNTETQYTIAIDPSNYSGTDRKSVV